MTDWRAAVAATPVAALLPARHAWRVSEAMPELVDELRCGDQAVLIVRLGDDLVVVPSRAHNNEVQRTGIARAALLQSSVGRFAVQCLAEPPAAHDEQPIDVDQTNESVVLGDWVVKWQVRVQPSPALARMRAIADAVAGGLIPDEHISPQLRGSVEWSDDSGSHIPILIAADYLVDSDDGWTWAVDLVRAHARGSGANAIAPFARLGRMTALMHVAFAADGVGHWGAAELTDLHRAARADLDEAIALVDGPEGERLRARAQRIADGIDALSSVDRTPVIAIHGDFHVGQILRTPTGHLAIVDFDGNPVQSPAERLVAQPAARDVAGMLASIDHVARVVNYRTPGIDQDRVITWIPLAQQAYLDTYRRTLADFNAEHIFDDRLLTPFVLHQETREFIYSVRHLPHWRYVPDAVLSAMFPEEL